MKMGMKYISLKRTKILFIKKIVEIYARILY